jgi:rhomboid protease GluP
VDHQPSPLEQAPAVESPAGTFPVSFSDPSAWARFGARSPEHWKLAGKGEIAIEGSHAVLRGRRPRPFWVAAKAEIQIPLADIINVIREGPLVQCHVRVSGASKVLRLWSANEQAAERLVQALPRERTAEFEQQLAEHSSFNTALSSVGTRPLITPALLILNCAVFALTVYAGAGLIQANGAVLVQWGTNYGPRTLDGESWRLFTSMFLHFGLLHLALNMWALWGVGQLTEKLYGSAYFLVLYVFAGLSGSLASLYWHPNLNSAGASGAIFGVIGGLLAFMVNPKTRIPPSVARGHLKSAGVFVVYNLFNGFAHAGIDNAAHVGGLLGGFAMGWVLARPVGIEARQNPLPRLVGGTLLGIGLLAVLSWSLFHPSPTVAAERNFRHQFQLFADQEEKAIAAQHALDQLESSKSVTHREWGRRVAAEIIPEWQAAEDQISLVKLPAESRLFPLRVALLEYLDQKRQALELLSNAARYNNSEELQRGTEVANSNNAKAQEIKALIQRVY